MTDKEILQKALEKAGKNGYKYYLDLNIDDILFCVFESQDDRIAIEEIIFDHDFAKAFWIPLKECQKCDHVKGMCEDYSQLDSRYCFEYHLKQMVLDIEPLKYIEVFL